MEINKKFHEDLENVNDVNFNDFSGHTQIFVYAHRNSDMAKIDYQCRDITGRQCAVELKTRDAEWDTYSTIYIECSKFYELLDSYDKHNNEPVYINFFNNKCVGVFKLKDYDPRKLTPYHDDINNRGYNGDNQQKAWRFHLPIADMTVYQKSPDGSYIKMK